MRARDRAVLEAVCARMVPPVLEPGASNEALMLAVEQTLRRLDARQRRRFVRALRVLDHPLSGVTTDGRAERFTARDASSQESLLRAWERSRLGGRRRVLQALRRLILGTCYARAETWPRIGYRGTYHERGPVLAWEGPLTNGAPAGAVATGGPVRDDGLARGPRPAPASIAAGSIERVDVCVIGAGAGGAVAAARLAECGRSVLVLEQGEWLAPEDFTEREAVLLPRLYVEGGAQATDDLAITLLQGRGVGGGTTVNWMAMLRPPAWVMEEWSAQAGDSIVAASALVPALEIVEQAVHAQTVPDSAHSPANRLLLEGAARLGWATAAVPIAARDCVRAGLCALGCRYGAKRGALWTWIPRAVEAGARVVPQCRVERIDIIERGGRAPLKRVRARIHDGRPREIVVETPIVVVAAGAIGTPALLERSGIGGGGVGRYLRLHPTTVVLGFHDRLIDAGAGVPLSAMVTQFLEGDRGHGFCIECPAFLPGMAAATLPGFGWSHAERMRRISDAAPFIVIVRDGAGSDSQGRVLVDGDGRAHVRYALGRSERALLADAVIAAARIHLAAGARAALTLHAGGEPVRSEDDLASLFYASYRPNRVGLFSAHLNGTCRIGTRPSTSGCDGDGQRHSVPGVYVADGSLLPSAPGVNPQATIMALGWLVAERIRDRHPA